MKRAIYDIYKILIIEPVLQELIIVFGIFNINWHNEIMQIIEIASFEVILFFIFPP